MNWLDLLIGILFLLTVVDGFRRGFFLQILELGLLAVSIWLGLQYYDEVADWLVRAYHTSPLVAKPAGFLGIWLLVQLLGASCLWLISRWVPETIRHSRANRLAGVLPAVGKTAVYLGVGLTILLVSPVPADLKSSIEESFTGPRLMYVTSGITSWLERSLGRTFAESFNFLTTPKTGVGYKIPAITDPGKLQIEPDYEAQIQALVNGERLKAGLKPVAFDGEAQAVARAHSFDMWQRGFFDHVNPDGQDVGDRFEAAGISYLMAGENLALAPTVLIAHEGLMHSASHRENILQPGFRWLGVGVVSAGAQGLMITQNFRD
jgi:uncharacterized protein YkwD